MADILKVTFVDRKFIDKLKRSGEIRELNQATSDGAQGIAEFAKRRMSSMLSKQHRYRVGASGSASENLFVEKIRSDKGIVYWAVVEGEKTIANTVIRKGFGAYKTPKFEVLKKWAENKGLKFRSYYERAQYKVSSYQRMSKLGKQHTVRGYMRSYTGENQKRDDDPYYRIMSRLYKYGSSAQPSETASGSHWMRLYPTGKGRFDYPTKVMQETKGFNLEANKILAGVAQIYVEYISTGRKRKSRRALI
jgi:hypothetical protein